MFLDDRNILYDESPLNSLIFVENGISLLHVSDKKADIFLGSRTETTINGDNAQVNLFTTLEHSTDFYLDGAFSGLSINIYLSSALIDAQIIGDKMIFGGLTV